MLMDQTLSNVLTVGYQMPKRVLGPISPAHIVRWSAAMENWHRIHYDVEFARSHDGLPDVLINGSWKQHILIAYLTDWAGPQGWLIDLEISFRRPSEAWEVLTCHGEIASVERDGDLRIITIEAGMKNADSSETAPSKATILLANTDASINPVVIGEYAARSASFIAWDD